MRRPPAIRCCVRELLKTLQAEDVRPDRAHADAIREVGPRAVSRTVLLRLARLPPDAVPVARAVAVLGDGAGLRAVAMVAQIDEHRVAVAARALAGAEILRAEPPLGFVHPLVRDAVYHDLAAAERELLHERAARALLDARRRARAGRSAAACRAVPRRAMGRHAAARGGSGGAAPRCDRERGAVPAAGARGAAPGGAARAVAAGARVGGGFRRIRRRPSRTSARCTISSSIHRSARRPPRCSRGCCCSRARPQEAATVVQRALADLPAEHAGTRQALEALELYAVAFGAQVPDAAERLARVRAAGLRKGLGGEHARAASPPGTGRCGAARRRSAPSSRSRCSPTAR